MSDASTLGLIATHLALAMRPLGAAVADLDSFKQFMHRAGWEVDDLPPAYVSLGTTVQALSSAVDNLGDDPSLEQIADLLNRLAALVDAIRGITTAPAGVDPGAFLSDIGERLFEILLVDYLFAEVPFLARLLELLDVIQFTVHPAAAGRPAFTETRFRFGEIPAVIADPLSIPSRVYGWGTAALDFELIAGHVQELLLALDIPSAYRHPSLSLGNAFQANPETATKSIDLEVRIPIALVELPDGPGEVGLSLLELPGEDSSYPGLILQPVVPSGLTDRTEITPELVLSFRAGSDLARTFGVFVRPGEIGVRYPFEPGTPPPPAGFGAELRYAPAEATVILGSATGSRLVLKGAKWSLNLDLVGTDAELRIEVATEGLSAVLALGDQDSFLASLFRGNDITIPIPLGLRWSNRRGFVFTGGAGLEVTVAPHLEFGPITVDTVHLAVVAGLSTGAPPALTAGVDVGLHGSLGPVAFSVEGVGVELGAVFQDGNAGPFDLRAGFKPPKGLGIVIDAGMVTGGGFLSYDRANGRYAGVVQLRIADIGLTAIGLLDTRLPNGQPGYSFVIIVAATFPPIQLGYGFTLNGAGGLAGMNRTVLVDALQAGLRNHTLDHVLFPAEPVANAVQIISDLRTFFPPRPGHFVFAPMALIGWGTPTLIRIELGLVLEFPAPYRLILLGLVRVALPTEDEPLLEINVDILGILDLEATRIAIDALIHDSRVGPFALTGAMAFRFGYATGFEVLVLAVGGVNPHFQPPPGFPALEPITVALGLDDNPRITLKGYLALTANTRQIGALAELYAAAGGFNIYGWIGFDALFVFLPFFSFVADFSGGVKLSRGSTRIAGVQLNATLSGISPFRAKGRACVSLWLFDVCVGFDQSFGIEDLVAVARLNPAPLLLAAISDIGNWIGTLPATSWRAASVSLPAATPDAHALVDPVGGVVFRQRVVPLNRQITRFGDSTPDGPGRYEVSSVTLAGESETWTAVQDSFAPAQFSDFTDAEKLSLPSFASMDAGIELAGSAIAAGPGLDTNLVYETRIVDRPWAGHRAPDYDLSRDMQLKMLAAGAAGRAPFRSVGPEKFMAPGARRDRAPALLAEEPYVIANTRDLSVRTEFGVRLSQHEAASYLAAHLARHPEDRSALEVVPLTEAA